MYISVTIYKFIRGLNVEIRIQVLVYFDGLNFSSELVGKVVLIVKN